MFSIRVLQLPGQTLWPWQPEVAARVQDQRSTLSHGEASARQALPQHRGDSQGGPVSQLGRNVIPEPPRADWSRKLKSVGASRAQRIQAARFPGTASLGTSRSHGQFQSETARSSMTYFKQNSLHSSPY